MKMQTLSSGGQQGHGIPMKMENSGGKQQERRRHLCKEQKWYQASLLFSGIFSLFFLCFPFNE